MKLANAVRAVCFPLGLVAIAASTGLGLWAVWAVSPSEVGLRLLGSALVITLGALVALASARQLYPDEQP